MDSFALENLLFNGNFATINFKSDLFDFLIGDKSSAYEKNTIRNVEVFRGLKNLCIRFILTDNSVFDFHNLSESLVNKLRSFLSSNYNLSLSFIDLEVFNTVEGNLIYSNEMICLQNEKLIFSIPRKEIKNIIELENDVQMQVGDMEIAFTTTSNISSIVEKKSVETCIINNVNCINPRSKTCLVFFDGYFVMKGSSYDHVLLYDNILELFYLKADVGYYLVLKLQRELVQGQTKYVSVVFLLTDKELEVVATDHRLKSFYNGVQHEIILEIFESILNLKAQESNLHFKATSKVFDGVLYFLNETLLFLPKCMFIPVEDISHVEFSRINLSKYQAKTFDMSVVAGKIFNFSGIFKDSFGAIESYFTDRNIKMVSEVIEDSVSEDTRSTDESEDLSDIIGSDD